MNTFERSLQLNLVHGNAAAVEIKVSLTLQNALLVVCFEVQQSFDQHVNSKFSKQDSIWGLWDWDVVEVFLKTNSSSATYYEFQLSPLDQWFELEIFKPRQDFNKNFRSGFKHAVVSKSDRHWQAQMQIDLSKLNWTGDLEDLSGNFFSILGREPQRMYWSAFLPRQEIPDFHKPEFFQNLFGAARRS